MGYAGQRIGSSPGSSLEFKDFRDYQPGDDLRRVDWGAYARSDRLAVRIYHDEVAPHADILIDSSLSMALSETAKADATRFLAAFFATAAINGGCSHQVWVSENGFRELSGGAGLPESWDQILFEHASSPPEAFALMPPRWRRYGIRIILSDLLWLGDPLAVLEMLGDGAASVVVVQVLAEKDLHPGTRGNVRLVDSETGEEQQIYMDAVTEKQYKEALAEHQQNWFRASRQFGANFVPVTAEKLFDGDEVNRLAPAQVLEAV